MRTRPSGHSWPAALRRALLPAVAAFVALAACANGGGLRVEGAEAPPAGPTPSAVLSTKGVRPEPRPTPEVALDLRVVRVKLLADRQLPQYARSVLEKCTVIPRCLSRGKTVDVMHSGRPQQIVFIHTLENFVFGFFLIAVEPSGPRPIWSLKADLPTVNASPQGELVVESKIFTIDDKICCPSGGRIEVYRWDGRQMAKVSSTDQ
jgi:hypothetical protein